MMARIAHVEQVASMANVIPAIQHPVRTTAILFGATSVLAAIPTPLFDEAPGPVVFLAFALASCLSLATLMVGMFLAFAGMRWRWLLLWGSFPLLTEAGYCVIVQSYIWFEGAEGWVTVVAHAAWPTVAIVLTWFAASGMVAIWGWIRYFRKLRLPKTAALNSPR